MLHHYRWILAGLIAVGLANTSTAQQAQPAAEQSLKEESTYFDLRRSKDRLTQQIAERYSNLVKLQEWSSAKGTKINAKYVSHDPDLQWVELSTTKGRGADRVIKEVKVPVAQLSKTCQSRVKQIATLQKKLDELAAKATAATEPGQVAASGFPEGEPGAPMLDERGVEPRALRTSRRPAAPDSAPVERDAVTAQPSEAGPSGAAESGDDPLGFGELPAGPAAAVGPPLGSGPPGYDITPAEPAVVREFPVEGPSSPVNEANTPHALAGARKPWQTEYEAFRASFKTYAAGKGQPNDGKLLRVKFGTVEDPNAEWDVDFGELDDFRAIADLGALIMNPNRSKVPPADRQRILEAANAAEKRVVEVSWTAPLELVTKVAGADQHAIRFNLPPMPTPLSVSFYVDQKDGRSTPEEWAAFSKGDQVRFVGWVKVDGPSSFSVYAREPQLVEAAQPTASESPEDARGGRR